MKPTFQTSILYSNHNGIPCNILHSTIDSKAFDTYEHLYKGPCILNYHNDIEILVGFTGSLKITIEDKIYSMGCDDICVISSSMLHQVMPQPNYVSYYVIKLSSEFFSIIGLEIDQMKFKTKLNDTYLNDLLLQLLKLVCDNGNSPYDDCQKLKFFCLCFQALHHLIKHYRISDQNIINGTNFAKDTVVKLADFITKKYAEQISLDKLSEIFYISKSYMCKIFKAHTGSTIVQYINEVRISHAYHLIENKKMPIKEACKQCGIENPSYFAKLWKKKYKNLPSSILNQVD